MHKSRALQSPIARILAGTGAVLTISFTIYSLAATSSAQPDVVAAAVHTSPTSVSPQQLSPAVAAPATIAEVAPTTNDSAPVVTTAEAPETSAPEVVSNQDATPPTESITPQPVAPDAKSLVTGRVMHTTEPVNLRDAAGVDGSTVIDTLPGNQQISSGDAVDGWMPVQWGETYGWISASYLADGPAAAPAPAAPAAEQPAAPAVEQPAAPAAEQPAAPAVEPAPAEPAPAESAENWMAELIPQVDPNGLANWVFERNGGWGASDGHTVYIDPNVPAGDRFSVMVHEYSHILQARVFGSLRASKAALSAIIGASPSDITANESTADCMALMQGATWVDYGCQDQLRPAAAAILAGNRP